MKRANILQAITLAEKIGKKENNYGKASMYMQLLKLAKQLSTIDIHNCNGTKFSGDLGDVEHEKACNKIYSKLDDICKDVGLFYYHQADPRGASLYVDNQPIPREAYTNALAIY